MMATRTVFAIRFLSLCDILSEPENAKHACARMPGQCGGRTGTLSAAAPDNVEL
jgi:hypothetical protein